MSYTNIAKTTGIDLKKYSENKSGFVLRRNFPQEEYKISEKRTLKELGLYPTATLIMK